MKPTATCLKSAQRFALLLMLAAFFQMAGQPAWAEDTDNPIRQQMRVMEQEFKADTNDTIEGGIRDLPTEIFNAYKNSNEQAMATPTVETRPVRLPMKKTGGQYP